MLCLMLSLELGIKYWFRFVRVIVRDEDCFQLSPSRRIYYSFSLLPSSVFHPSMFCQESLTHSLSQAASSSYVRSFSISLSSGDRLSGNDYFCQVPKRGKKFSASVFFLSVSKTVRIDGLSHFISVGFFFSRHTSLISLNPYRSML